MTTSPRTSAPSSELTTYFAELGRYPLLKVEEEQRLARRFAKGDLQAGHTLVTSNLRFVVKIANEYRSYGIKISDLIQEGNIGLLKAVQKFDATKEIRLISYAVWWIRAYIQDYILKSWSLVKIGTTQAQRKLFFNLARARRELEKYENGETLVVDADQLAKRLNVKPAEVLEMQQRLGHDLSLDTPLGDDDSAGSHLDLVPSGAMGADETFGDQQETAMVHDHVQAALTGLDARERFIVESRFMSDNKMTLKELGEHFGFSRERARQLEIRAMQKLKDNLAAFRAEVGSSAAFASL